MARKLLALIAKLRSPEDAIFAARLSSLAGGNAPHRARGLVSPFRFVAHRAA